jgi:hypothetical protein
MLLYRPLFEDLSIVDFNLHIIVTDPAECSPLYCAHSSRCIGNNCGVLYGLSPQLNRQRNLSHVFSDRPDARSFE